MEKSSIPLDHPELSQLNMYDALKPSTGTK